MLVDEEDHSFRTKKRPGPHPFVEQLKHTFFLSTTILLTLTGYCHL